MKWIQNMTTTWKKITARINIALGEYCMYQHQRGGATHQKSIVFKNLNETENYRNEYNGQNHGLSQREVTLQQEKCVEDHCLSFWRCELEQESFHILNFKDRYIQELLLQKHNFAIYKAYYKIKGAGIQV